MLCISNSDKLMIVQIFFLCTKIVEYFRRVDLIQSYEFFCEKLCYAKGEFLHLNFLTNNMCNIGAVIAQLVTV